MKKYTSVILVKKDDVDEFIVDGDDGIILNDSIGESELELPPVLVGPPAEAQKEQVRESPMQVAEEQNLEMKTLERGLLLQNKSSEDQKE